MRFQTHRSTARRIFLLSHESTRRKKFLTILNEVNILTPALSESSLQHTRNNQNVIQRLSDGSGQRFILAQR
jgi:hypothetical protein